MLFPVCKGRRLPGKPMANARRKDSRSEESNTWGFSGQDENIF